MIAIMSGTRRQDMSQLVRGILMGRGWVDIEALISEISLHITPEHAARRHEAYLVTTAKRGRPVMRSYSLSEKIQFGKRRICQQTITHLSLAKHIERKTEGDDTVIQLTEAGQAEYKKLVEVEEALKQRALQPLRRRGRPPKAKAEVVTETQTELTSMVIVDAGTPTVPLLPVVTHKYMIRDPLLKDRFYNIDTKKWGSKRDGSVLFDEALAERLKDRLIREAQPASIFKMR